MRSGLKKSVDSSKSGADRMGAQQVVYALPCLSSRKKVSSQIGLDVNLSQINTSRYASGRQITKIRAVLDPLKTMHSYSREFTGCINPIKCVFPQSPHLSNSPFSHQRVKSLVCTKEKRDNHTHIFCGLDHKKMNWLGRKERGANHKYRKGNIVAREGVKNSVKLFLTDFEIAERTGGGYFGGVSLVKWRKNFNKPCVLKSVSKKHALTTGQVTHLRNEKEFLKSLHHPFIIHGYGTFQDAENLYFVMEYIPGGELYLMIRKQLKSKLESILFYLTEIALALEYLHEKQIVYRDLKPENILVDDRGHAKLIDLGFSKKITNNRTASLCGTPGYLAPEQIARQEYGKEVDIWAFGVTMFELLAGYNPFFDRDPLQFIANVNSGSVNWPSYMPRPAIDFLKRLLVTDPEARLPFSEFKEQPLFKDRDQIQQQKISPPAIPTLSGAFDTHYFKKKISNVTQTCKEADFPLSDPFIASDAFKDFLQ